MDKPVELNIEQWVDSYSDMMFRFTVLRVKDQDAAEEIVQATFVSALKSKDSFQGRSSEKSWLFGILKHKIMDHFREQKKYANFDTGWEDEPDPLDAAYHANGTWKNQPQHWDLDPEHAHENSQLAEILTECLDGLSDKFRQIFVLKEIDGMDSEALCKEFDIKPTNLWVILHRARAQLRKCLEVKWLGQK